MGQHFTLGWHFPHIKCPLRQLKMGAARGTSKHTGHSIKLSSFSVVSSHNFLEALCSSDIFLHFAGGEFGSKFELRWELELEESKLLASLTISSEIDAAGLAVMIRPESGRVKLTEDSRFSITKDLLNTFENLSLAQYWPKVLREQNFLKIFPKT